MWAGISSGPSEVCLKPGKFSGTRWLKNVLKSYRTVGSAFSLILNAADVCLMKRCKMPVSGRFGIFSRTCGVIKWYPLGKGGIENSICAIILFLLWIRYVLQFKGPSQVYNKYSIIFASMKTFFYLSFAFILLAFNSLSQSQSNAFISGKVTDNNNLPLELVNISVAGIASGTVTDKSGKYKLEVASGIEIELIVSFIGYKPERKAFRLQPGQEIYFPVVLLEENEQLKEVNVQDMATRSTNLVRINPRLTNIIPDASGCIEAMVKTMPGVRSNNELSSQYSVRGGNYDENLVYVNGIEVYRPFLIRSGQQEGMSFINSDMVASVLFSAGGFEAKYGDKMSSVLDIQYKKPVETGVNITSSLMGANVEMEGTSKNRRFTHISGVRYKTSKYLLNSLDVEGDYNPRFTDFQTYLTYDITDRLEVAVLGNFARNKYEFVPHDRETSFGTVNEAYKLKIYFEGQEVDDFSTAMGATSFQYRVHDRFKIHLTASVFNTIENETFDILSQYWINQLDNSGNVGDSVANIGVGTFLDHARNRLNARVYTLEHKASLENDNSQLLWGIKYQRENINDDVTEWRMVDSAGYSIPYTDSVVSMHKYLRSKNDIESERASAYIQNSYSFEPSAGKITLNAGLRANYWTLNQQFVFSPRVSLAFSPNWQRDFIFRLAAGYYNQPPFYKELRNRQGDLNKNLKAQESFHIVGGMDYVFSAWNRPFKLVAEIYYKFMDKLVPYDIDNVRIRYYGDNLAKGYATGMDLKINGEFVPGVDSWLSIGILRSKEDIYNDFYVKTTPEGESEKIYPGYIRRPSDQLLNVAMFFQDYLPGNPSYKMQMSMMYGTNLPFGPPDSERYMATGKMPSYRRVDIGFSKLLKSEKQNFEGKKLLNHFKSLWIGLEVFNLLDTKNTISYVWVTDIRSRQYAVSNYLTSRRLNLKITASF